MQTGNIHSLGTSSMFIMPSLKKEGILHCTCPSVCLSVGMSVSLNLVQLITQERFAREASNLVGR